MLPYHVCVEFTNGELMQYFVLGVVFGMWFMYLLLCILCCINRDRKRKARKKGKKHDL